MKRSRANKIIEMLVRLVTETVPDSSLKKIYLFGSVAKTGEGNDLDLILEVDAKTFRRYCELCHGGSWIHEVSGDVIADSPRWYYSWPKEVRTQYAIEVTNAYPYYFLWKLSDKERAQLDFICLPEGWDVESSDVYQKLLGRLKNCRDPNFLTNVMAAREQVFPAVPRKSLWVRTLARLGVGR